MLFHVDCGVYRRLVDARLMHVNVFFCGGCCKVTAVSYIIAQLRRDIVQHHRATVVVERYPAGVHLHAGISDGGKNLVIVAVEGGVGLLKLGGNRSVKGCCVEVGEAKCLTKFGV